MFYHIFTDRDATIYEKYPERNTGIDQILQLTKIASGSLLNGFYQANTYNTRILIDFKSQLTEVSNSIVNGDIPTPSHSPSGSQYFLNLKAIDANSLPISYSIVAYPLSQSWENGTGYFNDVPEDKEGVSWKYRRGSIGWASGSQLNEDGGGGTTEGGGGSWTTGSYGSASFNYQSPDVRMNITDIVKNWFNGTRENHGLIIKRPTVDEQSSKTFGSIGFFSKDTNTVYVPKLEIGWSDYDESGTGSFSQLSDDNVTVYFKNLRPKYKEKDQVKIRVVGRKTYPTKTYSTASFYSTIERLPTSSYYSVKDASTEETIIPFDDKYTQISCDTSGNYFKIRFNTFFPERTYKFLIRTEEDGGSTIRTYDNGYYFKVMR